MFPNAFRVSLEHLPRDRDRARGRLRVRSPGRFRVRVRFGCACACAAVFAGPEPLLQCPYRTQAPH